MHDNTFLEISDVEAAQKLSDRINPEDLHKVLDAFAKRYCPVPETLGLSYIWTIQQIECATNWGNTPLRRISYPVSTAGMSIPAAPTASALWQGSC